MLTIKEHIESIYITMPIPYQVQRIEVLWTYPVRLFNVMYYGDIMYMFVSDPEDLKSALSFDNNYIYKVIGTTS